MALNIFPRKKEEPRTEPPISDASEAEALPLPTNTTGESRPASRRRRSSSSRGGRQRSQERQSDSAAPAEEVAATAQTESASTESAPSGKSSTSRRGRRSRAGSRSAEAKSEAKAAPGTQEQAASSSPAPAADPEFWNALRELRQQVAELTAALKEQAGRVDKLLAAISADGERTGHAAAPPARVGVFVDVANIELAAERHGVRLDWGAVLERLTEGRQLVRAIAYAPVHDDPEVSPEAQRFVEPFLDRGFKIVTKPLRRFSDGSIKANVDIEMALDIVTMSDRLDVVVLVSGDGDFTHLVDVVQSRGLRVEVAGFETSTASVLRNAADRYIDLMPLAKRGRR